MDEFERLCKEINKDYGMEGISTIGVTGWESKGKFSLGSPSLDIIVYGGVPRGIIGEISGAESAGKTTLAFLMASDFIKQEKQKPEEERQHILFVDAETTADPDWAYISTGYDMNDKEVKTIYITPQGQSAEEIFDIVMRWVKTGKIGLVLFDSLVSIAGQQTNNKSMTEKDMGIIAKVLADFVRRNTGVLKRFNTSFIGLNGLIQNIGGYGNPETTPGGTYWRRACSLRLRVKRGEFFDEDGNKVSVSGSDKENPPAGNVIDVALLKTKFCRWDRKLGKCHLHYVKGIDLLQDTIDIAVKLDLIRQTGAWYTLVDNETGEVLTDEEGNLIKLNGSKKLKAYLEENVKVWRKLYDKIYEIISVKENPNCISYEKMLNVNVEEEFGIDFNKEEE